MDIDLSRVIGYSRDSLQSRALMRSIMFDLYPSKIREINILLNVYESGVPRKIKLDGHITESEYVQYVQKIVNDYGMQEQGVVDGLNAWIDFCLGKGTASTIKYQTSATSVMRNDINENSVRKKDINPIVHDAHVSFNNLPVEGNASDYKIKNLGNRTIEIKKFLGSDLAEIIIPTEIKGKKVVGIGLDAFKQCKCIKRLIIPEGIEYISDGAFAECENLTQVVLPTSLKELGTNKGKMWSVTGVFERTGLQEITLPNNIIEISRNTFLECESLAKIVFPDNLRRIEDFAFMGCNSLTEIILPSGVQYIGFGAFRSCHKLSNISLNEGLKMIGAKAFDDDPLLTLLVIPKSVTAFGDMITGSHRVTIGCYPGSEAIEYARTNNLPTKDMSK